MTDRFFSSSGFSNHPLQTGFIDILNVIDPFTYSVQCHDCISLQKMNLELKRIIPECISLKLINVMNMKNLLVIVEDFDQKCYRGLIKYVEKPGIFHIHRMDLGDDITIQRPNIYCLPDNLCKFEAQRHKIKLYGIIPSPNVSNDQLRDFNIFLKNLMCNVGKTKLNDCHLINNYYYGSIEIEKQFNDSYYNICLADLLLEKLIAIPSLNFEKDIASDTQKKKEDFVPEHTFVEKVAESVRSIEITPQHSVYLNALTSGLLINPEFYGGTSYSKDWPKSSIKRKVTSSRIMAKKGSSIDIKKNLQHETEELQKLSGMGHGRINSVERSGPSGGRGKIKSLVGIMKENKVNSNDGFKPVEVLEREVHVSEQKAQLVLDRSMFLTDIETSDFYDNNGTKKPCLFFNESKRSPKSGSSSYFKEVPNDSFSKEHDINKTKSDEESNFRCIKSSNKHSKLDCLSQKNKNSKHLKQNNNLLTVGKDCQNKISPEQYHEKNNYNSSCNEYIKAEAANPTISPKTGDMACENINEKDTVYGIEDQVPEFLSKSTKVVIKECSNISLNDSVLNQNRNISNDSQLTKSRGRGLLFNALSSKVNDSNCSNIQSKSEIVERCDVLEQSFSDINNTTSEKKLEEPDTTNPLEDTNDHEDRYFDIEEPAYLNCSYEYSSDGNKREEKNETQANNEHYEKLLSLANNNEHDPLDNKALITPVKPGPDLLEQQILRDYTVGQITERMKMSCGLIHGNVVANPVTKLSELKLQQHILSNLNAKNMRELSRSQMFAVPVLLQRKNLVLIGPPNSGKTLAYVMSILSLLQDGGYYASLKSGNGPRCVFISSCAQNVNYISQFCSAICGAKLTIITTHGGGLELERKEDLTNGCEILVTTPRCWLRLLKHTSVTNLSRLCHIIFDDTDKLLSTFLPEVQDIMSKINKMLHIRKRYCNNGMQVVFVGEKWTPVLEEITFRALDSPVLCITAHLEAALYARIKPKTYILSPDAKLKKLKELLTITSQKIRTVIVCRCAAEVKSLRPLLEPTLSDVLVAHEEMSLSRVVEVSDQWVRCTSPPILLCSDLILNELAVTNAQWLIHYSMPDNKTSFSERFSTIKEHLYDRIKYPKTAPPECQVHILVDDTNELQFPEIINFMERLGTPIPDLFLQAVKKISIMKEERKMDAPFCESMLMFGSCWKKDKCKRQHIFNKSRDHPGILPVNGTMKVKLLYAHNPSHYSVRILAIKDGSNDEEWTDFPSNYALIAFKMSNHYSFRENRFAHGRVKIGDLVAIEVEPDLLFKRAKVIDIFSRDDKFNPEQVIVYFVDEGSLDKCSAPQLLHLPSELQVFPQEAYDLYLTGLRPVDYDNAWSFASTLKIQKNVNNLNFSEGDNKFFIATVVLVAGKNLLATSFLCYEWLDLNKCHVVLFSPKKFILDTGLAESNPAHLTSLMSLALEAGLISNISEDLKKEDNDEEKEEIQWAFLDKEYCTVVHVISSDSPSLFYLKIYKFSDRVEELEKELTTLLNSKTKRCEVLEPDMVCAARNQSVNRWNRAMINEVINENEVEVFFVDYGDCLVVPLADIAHLPPGFIKRLPFQAIECSLIGILPVDDEWLPQAMDVFDDMFSNDENKLNPTYAKVCTTTDASTTAGHHYKVILANSMEDKEGCINKELVYRGFANWDSDTKHYLTENIVWQEASDILGGISGVNDQFEEWNDTHDSDTVPTGKKSVENIETVGSKEEGSSLTLDLKSILENGNFDLENGHRLLDFLPPELQYSLKQRNIEQALNELSDWRVREYEKEETKVSEEQSQTICTLKEGKNNLEENAPDQGPLLDSCGIYHPTVYWSQTDYFVKIKIDLSSIESYQIDYSEQSLMFSALVKEKYYWFDIILFGQICKENVNYSPKGLQFEIKMDKYIKGEFWPRLGYDDFKFPWIKLDPDFIDQDDITLIESMFNKGLRKDICSYSMMHRSNIQSLGGPETDSDMESECSKSGSEEYHDMMHDAVESDLD